VLFAGLVLATLRLPQAWPFVSLGALGALALAVARARRSEAAA
jgi:hypothetical protein